MAGLLRDKVHWADLNPTKGREQAGIRPVLILSQDVFNERSGTVIAVALTSRPPSRLSLDAGAVKFRSAQEILGQNQPDPEPSCEEDQEEDLSSL